MYVYIYVYIYVCMYINIMNIYRAYRWMSILRFTARGVLNPLR